MIPVAALAVYMAWLVLAFGLRSLVQWRRTGDAGWRFPGVRPGDLQWWSRMIVGFGAVGAGLVAPIADVAGLPPIGAFDRDGLRVAGLSLTVVAAGATFAAQIAMGASWRIGVDEAKRTILVTGGPFRLACNRSSPRRSVSSPGLLWSCLLAVAGLVGAIVGVQLQVRRIEEPNLLRIHGEHYRTYAAQVGRFLPGIGRLPTDDQHQATGP